MKKIFLLSTLVLVALATTAGLVRKSTLVYAKTGLTATATSTAIRLNPQVGKYYTLGVAAAISNTDGTLPTADVKLQASPNCNDYIDVHTFTQVTTGSSYQTKALSDTTTVFYECWRVVATIAGTEPDYNIRVELYHD